MLPAALFTVTTPLATVHLAGDLSRTDTHWSRFLPSKRTMASEGGAVALSDGGAPGVTTGGTGVHCSVSWGFGAWQKATPATPTAAATPISVARLKAPSPC